MLAEPETVLAVGPSISSIHPGLELLIKWKGLPEYKASWEPLVVIKQQFPTFHLKDKVPLEHRGIDKPLIHFTHVRRKGGGESHVTRIVFSIWK